MKPSGGSSRWSVLAKCSCLLRRRLPEQVNVLRSLPKTPSDRHSIFWARRGQGGFSFRLSIRRSSRTSQICSTDVPAKKGPFRRTHEYPSLTWKYCPQRNGGGGTAGSRGSRRVVPYLLRSGLVRAYLQSYYGASARSR